MLNKLLLLRKVREATKIENSNIFSSEFQSKSIIKEFPTTIKRSATIIPKQSVKTMKGKKILAHFYFISFVNHTYGMRKKNV